VESYWGSTIHRLPRGATYAWAIDDGAAAPPQNDDVDQLIRGRTEQLLDKMGYRKHTDSAKPDFLVSFRAGSGLQPSSSGPQRMALLTIEAISTEGRLIWRGSAEGVVDPSLTPEERTKRIKRAVRLILKPFKPA
jgi:hypothetical protein